MFYAKNIFSHNWKTDFAWKMGELSWYNLTAFDKITLCEKFKINLKRQGAS